MKTAANRALAAAISRLIGATDKQRLSILIYHRVLSEPDYIRSGEPGPQQFQWQMDLLARYFNPLSLSSALSLMETGSLPERAVCVTFDDGYADNAAVALPILKRFGIPATIFVSSSFLDGGIMWNDRVIEAIKSSTRSAIDMDMVGLGTIGLESPGAKRAGAFKILDAIKHLSPKDREDAVEYVGSIGAEPSKKLMLSTEQMRHLYDSGMEIGAHTHTHPILTSLSPEKAKQEIIIGRQRIESLLDAKVNFFAYPNGKPIRDYQSLHRDIVQDAGFQAACSTHWGVSSPASDKWQLARFTPWDASPQRFLLRLLLNLKNEVIDPLTDR
jgi:peptidoglycan/xylan/chitin deacetylase (PgdA/CDA1 family)